MFKLVRESHKGNPDLQRYLAVARPDFIFKITNKTQVDVDLHRKRIVISCITKDGKSVHLETDYEALEQLHSEIQRQLNN
jgi:hypothetical protein